MVKTGPYRGWTKSCTTLKPLFVGIYRIIIIPEFLAGAGFRPSTFDCPPPHHRCKQKHVDPIPQRCILSADLDIEPPSACVLGASVQQAAGDCTCLFGSPL